MQVQFHALIACRAGAARCGRLFRRAPASTPRQTGLPRRVRGRASAVGGRRAPTPGSEAGPNAGELRARRAGFSGPFGCAFPNQADRGAPRAGVRRWSAAAIRERRSDGSVSSRAKPGDTSTGRAVSSAAWRGNGWIGGATTKRAPARRHGRTWTRGAGPGRRKHNRQGQRGGASTACRGGARTLEPAAAPEWAIRGEGRVFRCRFSNTWTAPETPARAFRVRAPSGQTRAGSRP